MGQSDKTKFKKQLTSSNKCKYFYFKNVNDTLKAVMTTEQNIQKLHICICIFPQNAQNE